MDQVAIIEPDDGIKNSILPRGLEVKSLLKTLVCCFHQENSNCVLCYFQKGFVVAISPFNFTAIGGNLATGPAILGNVVLWKPALTTTRASWLVYEILEEAGVPPGTDIPHAFYYHATMISCYARVQQNRKMLLHYRNLHILRETLVPK